MTTPGFTAEASLATASVGRWIGAATEQKPDAEVIVPQGLGGGQDNGCEMFIACVDGIRYLVRDCPDGSGDETPIGVCQLLTSKYFHLRHSWLSVLR